MGLIVMVKFLKSVGSGGIVNENLISEGQCGYCQ